MADSHSERVTERDRRMGCCCAQKGQQRNQYPRAVFSRPVASTSPDNMIQMQILPPLDLLNQKFKGGPSGLVLTSTLFTRDADALLTFWWGPANSPKQTLPVILTHPHTYSSADSWPHGCPPTYVIYHFFAPQRESIPFLTIFLNPTPIKFMYTVLDQNCSCQNHQWTHFAKFRGCFSHCLTWVIHTIWHNGPNFLPEALPPLGCLLPYWSVLPVGPLYMFHL